MPKTQTQKLKLNMTSIETIRKKSNRTISQKKKDEKPQKKAIILNPVDTLIRINGSDTTRERILNLPWYCRAYLDCMELVPGAREIIASLTEQSKDTEIILETPYDEEIVWAIAQKFHIPFTNIRRKKAKGSSMKVKMDLRKKAS